MRNTATYLNIMSLSQGPEYVHTTGKTWLIEEDNGFLSIGFVMVTT